MTNAKTLTTEGFEPDVRWTPFIDGIRVGYKCRRLSDGRVTFVYFNPSSSGEGEPDVFVYVGTDDDPVNDEPVVFITPHWGGA